MAPGADDGIAGLAAPAIARKSVESLRIVISSFDEEGLSCRAAGEVTRVSHFQAATPVDFDAVLHCLPE